MRFQKPPTRAVLNPLHPLSRGLVGYWLFNEGAGSLVNDISGHGNHGKLTNMLPNIQGSGWGGSKCGGALNFDGIDDYVNCGNDARLNVTDAITIEVWVKRLGSSSGDYGYIVDKGINEQWILFQNKAGTDISFNIKIGGALTTDLITFDFTDSQWHQIVCSYSNGSKQVWIDSVNELDNVENGEIGITAEDLVLGGRIVDNIRNFNGLLDVVRIYNRALSAAEVKMLYEQPYCNLMK